MSRKDAPAKPSPVPRSGTGRHRKPRPASRVQLLATAVAVGAVAAVGQPLLTAAAEPQADLPVPGPDTFRMAFTAPAPQAKAASAALPTLVPPRQAAVGVVGGESGKLDRALRVQENQRLRVAQAEAERKRLADEAAAKDAAAKKAAALAAAPKAPAVKAQVVKPAQGRFTSGFGARWGTTHYGIDIANSIGTPIVSAAAGVVIEAGPASGFGLWVRVRHDDGTITVYGHMQTIVVREGTRVTAGQKIATIGNRGQSTGPHLHFEVWLDGGRKTDPVAWLRARGVAM